MTRNEALLALSPLDGRYKAQTEPLRDYFSEQALIRYRCMMECEYFISLLSTLSQAGQLPKDAAPSEETKAAIRRIYQDFSIENGLRVKEIESTTRHDVKAVEYFLKEQKVIAESPYKEFIHFGLTSQDINNTATPLMLKDAMEKVVLPQLKSVLSLIDGMVETYASHPMLARTHGQSATPTVLGREFQVFSVRLSRQIQMLESGSYPCKMGGATGGMNAHRFAFPEIDWNVFFESFCSKMGLRRDFPTTQIDHYDGLSEIFDGLKRCCSILIDLCRDMWMYISQGYFKLKTVAGEVGSSAMPHKVNPIDFENAEGNLMIAISYLDFLSSKLPVSRLQRDLTDSTVMRNIGMPAGHIVLACCSAAKGLGKCTANSDLIISDLNAHPEVISEGIQTILRAAGYPQPYEALKAFTRGQKVSLSDLHSFCRSLEGISEEVRERLLSLTPESYI